MTPLAEDLTAHGVATWNLEYRRVGDDGGGWPGTFLDVAAGCDHLRRVAPAHGLDADRIVPVGHSAGGHLALWVAARGRLPREEDPLWVADPVRVAGAVSLAGIPDLRRAADLGFSAVRRLLGGTPAQVPARYAVGSPAALLPLGVRQVLVHGTDDHLVPLSLSEEYHAAASARGDTVELVALPGIGHFEPIDPGSSAWPVARARTLALVG